MNIILQYLVTWLEARFPGLAAIVQNYIGSLTWQQIYEEIQTVVLEFENDSANIAAFLQAVEAALAALQAKLAGKP